ncbi:cysteine dioxygenase family protein [Tenacibaculum sp. 190524A05c]|uniref:cysteine dioxygenase n=1 Tax=Tenacibaculum platacis TaxID=3137852 RepID=UPI0032B108C4
MSHANESFLRSPQLLTFNKSQDRSNSNNIKLIVIGQGTFALKTTNSDGFEIKLVAKENALLFSINKHNSQLFSVIDGKKELLTESNQVILDQDIDATYWVSLNGLNGVFKFGIGEVRNDLTQFEFETNLKWVHNIDTIEPSDNTEPVTLYRDPIVYDPSLKIISTDEITIEDIALNNYVVPTDLTESCQKLYNNISGKNFKLNTSDFPDFTDAIEYSIKTPGCWCYETLKEKADEFGEENPDETYLRITLGANQGDSPGIPYVIEIWPPNHYSPIHNHGDANAVIRVLHGEINVSLFPMLSEYHKTPFKSATFRKDEITWISPRYNQIHQLHNKNIGGPSCITIQCYMYGEANTKHYEYFDYLENTNIEQFTPNSDADYLVFKNIIKEEWNNKNQHVTQPLLAYQN